MMMTMETIAKKRRRRGRKIKEPGARQGARSTAIVAVAARCHRNPMPLI
jgi:hypothetical protein